MSLLNKKSFCVVTGASRGIGRCIAIEIAKQLGADSVLVLLARNIADLEDVKREILESSECRYLKLKVIVRQFDQGSTSQELFDNLFSDILDEIKLDKNEIDQAIIVHNAGTLGELKYCKNLDDLIKIRQFFDINLTGLVALNAKFLQMFSNQPKLVVNISSLTAIGPVKSWSLYSTVKAGRYMFFRSLVQEQPDTRVLHYSPGPVMTDMMNTACAQTEDQDVVKKFESMREKDQLLSCEQTVSKFINLLEKNQFENGAHVDFYDI